MSGVVFSPEVVALLSRAATYPRGVRLLYAGQLESVAVLFDARPALVDQVRGWISDTSTRPQIAEALIRARQDAPPASRPAPCAPRSPPTAEEILGAVSDIPDGDEFLRQAPLETLAVLFQVHPRVVERARALLDRARPQG